MNKPGQIIGYRKNGLPIRLIAGGSEPTFQPPAAPPQPIVIQNQPPAGQYFTAEQLEAARQQEKDKLYDRIEKMNLQLESFKSEVDTYKSEREAAKAEADRLAREAEEATRKETEAKMSVQELITAKQAEWDAQLASQKEELARAQALMEKERQFLSLTAYTQKRVAEEVAADTIAPELLDFIGGNSEAEVEASITKVKEKTASIVAGMTGQSPRVTPGVSPTGFAPTGPLDTLTGTRQLSQQDISNMSMSEYAKFRQQSGIDKAGNNKGLFN